MTASEPAPQPTNGACFAPGCDGGHHGGEVWLTAPEPVVLTDGEREALDLVIPCNDALDPDSKVCAEVTRLLTDRLAADRAAHEALRAVVERVEHLCNNPADAHYPVVARADLRGILAAAAPTPPQDAATEGGL